MGRVGIRPNNLTFLGLALTVAAAWQLYASDHDGKPVAILPGVALMLLAGLADGGDGLLARAAGQTSVRGGFLDLLALLALLLIVFVHRAIPGALLKTT